MGVLNTIGSGMGSFALNAGTDIANLAGSMGSLGTIAEGAGGLIAKVGSLIIANPEVAAIIAIVAGVVALGVALFAKFGKDPRVYQTTVKEFLKDEAGNLTGAVISCLKPERDPETGRTSMVPTGKEFTYDCQLAFIAAGFTGCENYTADAFGVELTARGNVADHSFKTNVDKVFVCGDMRRGQSLVVWGLREGRDCAAEVDRCLMGYTNL